MARGECPVCLERYDAASHAPMVSVACGHSVCAQCADKLCTETRRPAARSRRRSRRDPSTSRHSSMRHLKPPPARVAEGQRHLQRRLMTPTSHSDTTAQDRFSNYPTKQRHEDSSDETSDHGQQNHGHSTNSPYPDYEDIGEEDDDSVSQEEDCNYSNPEPPRCPTCNVVLSTFVKNFEALHALQSVADSQNSLVSSGSANTLSQTAHGQNQAVTVAALMSSASATSGHAVDSDMDRQRKLMDDANRRSRPLLDDVTDVEHVIDPDQLEFTRATSHELGVGSTGVVYRGTYKSIPVAIKCVRSNANNPTNAERFRRELQLISRLSHPHIVDFVGVAWDDGNDPANVYSSTSTVATPTVLLVTELMHGGTLRSALSALPSSPVGGLEVRSFLTVATHVARGLVYLHAEGFAHRDIKSANILLTHALLPNSNAFPPQACAKIADFGLSKHLDKLTGGAAYQQSAMEPGRLEATYAYLAPEAFGGDKKNAIRPNSDDDDGRLQETAKKRDIYALGVLFWEMITGLVPWAGTSLPDVYVRVCVRGDRPTPSLEDSRVPRTLRRLVDRCWAQDPLKRPSASSIVDKLERITSRLDISSKQDSQPHTISGASLYSTAPAPSFESRAKPAKGAAVENTSRDFPRSSSSVDQAKLGTSGNRRVIGSRPQTPVAHRLDVPETTAISGNPTASIGTVQATSAPIVASRRTRAEETVAQSSSHHRDNTSDISRSNYVGHAGSHSGATERGVASSAGRENMVPPGSHDTLRPSTETIMETEAGPSPDGYGNVAGYRTHQKGPGKLVRGGYSNCATPFDESTPSSQSGGNNGPGANNAHSSGVHPTYPDNRLLAGRQSPTPGPVTSSAGRYSVTQKYGAVSSGSVGSFGVVATTGAVRKYYERVGDRSGLEAENGRRISDPNDPVKKRQAALISAAFERSPSYAGPATTSGALATPSAENMLPGVVAVPGQPKRPTTRRMVSMEGVRHSSTSGKGTLDDDDDDEEFVMATVVNAGDDFLDEDPIVVVSHMNTGELLSALSQRSQFLRLAGLALAALECPRHSSNEEVLRNACALLHQLTVPHGGGSRDAKTVTAKEQISIRKYLKSNQGVAVLLRVLRVPNSRHPTTLSYALLTLGNLTAWDLDAHKDFRESDGVACVADCMLQYSDNMGIQEKGCYAIACTAATYSPKAKVAFLESNCVRLVISALSKSRAKIQNADAVTKQACAALGAMCSLCPDNAAKAESLGALGLLTSAFDAFRQASRVEGGKRSEMHLVCMAYLNLMCCSQNRRQTGQAGLSLILRSMRIFRLDGEFVERALRSLSEICNFRANAEQVLQLNGVDDVIASMVRFKLSVPIQHHGTATLVVLVNHTNDHARRRIVQASGAEAIVFALERFGTTSGVHADIAIEGCRAIATLCGIRNAEEGEILSKRMKKIRADRAIKQTIQAHRGHQLVQEKGKEALKNLSSLKSGSSWLFRIRHKGKS